jgi:hypothetical protein
LNLDDLNDNGPENSDVLITHNYTGKGIYFRLSPTNGATYYYSDLHSMSLESCMAHYPFTNMDTQKYPEVGLLLQSGRDYCVLTNEGRLSIIRFDQEFKDKLVDGSYYTQIEAVVTTYRQVVLQPMSSFQTNTPGPTPTPSNYQGMNLTNEQMIHLDQSARKLIDAISAGDKETVAKMIDYPIHIYIDSSGFGTTVNNEDEFITIYDKIFTPLIIEEFSNANVSDNTSIYYLNPALIVPDCSVFFYPDGRIKSIWVSSLPYERR